MYPAHSSPNSSSFTEYQRQFHQALSDEIKSLRKQGGQTTTITDGRRLGRRSGKHLYSFTTDTEIRFPDDTPVDIDHQKRRYSATLLSIERFDLTTTLGLTVASLLHAGEPVLVMAHSNTAVDTAIKSLAKYLCKSSDYNEGLILRFGSLLRQYFQVLMVNITCSYSL